MKLKIVCVFLAIFLIISCNHKFKDKEQENHTILNKTNSYFTDIRWTESESILPEPMPEPFSLKELRKTELALYSDTNIQESIFPEMDGLGILDYSGIDSSLLYFFENIGKKIKDKKIDSSICTKQKVFLPYLIDYRLKRIEEIKSIYFSRPEYKGNKKAIAIFRCNLNSQSDNTRGKYILLEITAVFAEEKWLIDSFDIIGAKNADPVKQN